MCKGWNIFMAKRKTQFVVSFNTDPKVVYQVVNNWLNANKFVYKEKYNTKYYQSGDGIWTTSRCFEYYFQGNQLIIYAYLKTPKNPFPLDNGMVGALNTTPYMNLINQLVETINNLNPVGQDVYNQQGYGQQMYPQPSYSQVQQANSKIFEEADKRNRNTAIGALAVSILNVLIMLLGYVYWVVLIIGFVLSVQGLQAKNKILGILSLLINTIILILFILIQAGVIVIFA